MRKTIKDSEKLQFSSSQVFERIYKEVMNIPLGQTKTYGQIAVLAKTHPRVVGMALHRNPSPECIPCHRVVFKDGSCSDSFAFGGKKLKKQSCWLKRFLLPLVEVDS